MARPLIKICGITDAQQAQDVAALGADAIGLNFVETSARFLTIGDAVDVAAAVGNSALRVGVFMDATASAVEAVLRDVPLDWIQFHGNEDAKFCEQFSLPYIKCFAVLASHDLAAQAKPFASADALLFDTQVKGVSGGTGETFDWRLWPDLNRPMILSGGLTPDNVGQAVRQLHPFAVDVASGVEGSTNGLKDLQKVERFVREVSVAARPEKH